MILWLIFAVMTASVLAAVLAPLLRGSTPAPSRAAYDEAVYRDQLAELERDAARGLIGEPEAQAARNELHRRMLAAHIPAPAAARGAHGRYAVLLAVVAVPAVALPLYLNYGAPHLPGMPLTARLDRAVETQDFAALVAKVEQQLARSPNDAEGWRVLAPAYKRMGRFADAARAYGQLARLVAPTASLLADRAEMLMLANGGLVPAEAAQGFAAALKLDPKHPKARFFQALALRQEGREGEAVTQWRALLADSPADAPWRRAIEAELQTAAGPTPEQVAAAQDMSAQDRDAMIRAMVDGLEARLRTEAADLEGWQKLIRARTVLGETDKAKAAYAAARAAFAGRPAALELLAEAAKMAGIE